MSVTGQHFDKINQQKQKEHFEEETKEKEQVVEQAWENARRRMTKQGSSRRAVDWKSVTQQKTKIEVVLVLTLVLVCLACPSEMPSAGYSAVQPCRHVLRLIASVGRHAPPFHRLFFRSHGNDTGVSASSWRRTRFLDMGVPSRPPASHPISPARRSSPPDLWLLVPGLSDEAEEAGRGRR